MIVGVPKEIKEGENRVAATPAGVHAFVAAGHRVVVERAAGRASGIGDPEYKKAGAEVLDTAAEVWGQAEMILKVKEPLPPEFGFLRPDLVVFTYLHLASDLWPCANDARGEDHRDRLRDCRDAGRTPATARADERSRGTP